MSSKVHQEEREVRTTGKGFTDVTALAREAVRASGVKVGLCSVFVRHTSASLIIQENADRRVQEDLLAFLERIAPEGDHYAHDDEGPDDMPAHIKSAITRTSETIPIVDGELALGTWQALYLVEHRARPHTRNVVVTVVGASV